MPEWLPPILVLVGLLGVLLSLTPMSRGRARFSFVGEKQELIPGTGGNPEYVEITGLLQNKSTNVNNVAELYLATWLPNRRDTKVFKAEPTRIQEGADEVRPHLRFDGKKSRRVTLTWKIPRTDAARFAFEVAIEDSDGKLFDQSGRLINRKNIERRHELANRRIANINDGGRRRVRLLRATIVVCDVGFAVRRLLWFLGF